MLRTKDLLNGEANSIGHVRVLLSSPFANVLSAAEFWANSSDTNVVSEIFQDLFLNAESQQPSNSQSSASIVSRPRRRRFGVCVILRNEFALLEFLVRHLLIGFEHFVLLDNNQLQLGRDIAMLPLLAPFIELGLVTYAPHRQNFHLQTQPYLQNRDKNSDSMQQCGERFAHLAEWMFMADSDEYLHITESISNSTSICFTPGQQQHDLDRRLKSDLHSFLRVLRCLRHEHANYLAAFVTAAQRAYPISQCALMLPWQMMYGEQQMLRTPRTDHESRNLPPPLLLDTFSRIYQLTRSAKVLVHLNRMIVNSSFLPHGPIDCRHAPAGWSVQKYNQGWYLPATKPILITLDRPHHGDGDGGSEDDRNSRQSRRRGQRRQVEVTVHLLHYYQQSMEHWLKKMEQSVPPYVRRVVDGYNFLDSPPSHTASTMHTSYYAPISREFRLLTRVALTLARRWVTLRFEQAKQQQQQQHQQQQQQFQSVTAADAMSPSSSSSVFSSSHPLPSYSPSPPPSLPKRSQTRRSNRGRKLSSSRTPSASLPQPPSVLRLPANSSYSLDNLPDFHRILSECIRNFASSFPFYPDAGIVLQPLPPLSIAMLSPPHLSLYLLIKKRVARRDEFDDEAYLEKYRSLFVNLSPPSNSSSHPSSSSASSSSSSPASVSSSSTTLLPRLLGFFTVTMKKHVPVRHWFLDALHHFVAVGFDSRLTSCWKRRLLLNMSSHSTHDDQFERFCIPAPRSHASVIKSARG